MDKQLLACVLASELMKHTSPQLGLNVSRVQSGKSTIGTKLELGLIRIETGSSLMLSGQT